MKMKHCVCAVMLALFFCGAPFSMAADLKTGDQFPSIELPAPDKEVHREYLGITQKETFQLADIEAAVVVIEIFSMYCPHCQREASKVNDFYYLLEKNPAVKGKVKIIGIGAGNDNYEVNFFRKKYDIPFPLFSDKNLRIHEKLGSVGTPYFFCIDTKGQNAGRIICINKGGFGTPEEFLNTILKEASLQ